MIAVIPPPDHIPTAHLAAGMGAYLLLSAAGVLLSGRAAAEVVAGLRQNRAVVHLTGAVAFFVGGAVLLVHARFGDWRQALVSLTAIWWMAEGAAMLAAPDFALLSPNAAVHLRRMNLVALPVGLALLAAAFLPGR